MKNIWQYNQAGNPYYENAFQVLGLWQDVIDPFVIREAMQRRQQRLHTMGEGYLRLGRRNLEESDLNNALDILNTPGERELETLLEHRPEQLPTGQMERLSKELVSTEAPDLALRHLIFLRRVVEVYARQALVQLPAAVVQPFPVDDSPIPPFGKCEETKHG